MSTKAGNYTSANVSNPLSEREINKLDITSADDPTPKFPDFGGGRTAKAPKGPVERGSTSGDEPRTKASS